MDVDAGKPALGDACIIEVRVGERGGEGRLGKCEKQPGR